MSRAKLILRVVGVCAFVAGLEFMPIPMTNPEALTQSLFVWLAMMGALIRPGLIVICVGVACLAVAALLPDDRE